MKKAFIALLLLAACKKENSAPPTPVDPVIAEWETYLAQPFKLVDFRAEDSIDYNDTDSVKYLEVDLNHYVPKETRDDLYSLANGVITIDQGALLKPGFPERIFTRPYSIHKDADGYYMDFISPDYTPLRLHFIDRGAAGFTVWFLKNGIKLDTKYERTN